VQDAFVIEVDDCASATMLSGVLTPSPSLTATMTPTGSVLVDGNSLARRERTCDAQTPSGRHAHSADATCDRDGAANTDAAAYQHGSSGRGRRLTRPPRHSRARRRRQ
jgi:hypothetical protein